MLILRQSTAVDVLIGPFVDGTDGVTTEEALSPSVQLSKNGQTAATKNDVTTPTHDNAGYYNCELDATDTNTIGTLVLFVEGASGTHLQVRHEYQVIEEAVYDALFASSAPGYLQPTTAGRTLDVTATGAAGVDWGNVENQSTAVDLSATDIQLADTVTTLTGHTAQTGDSFARLGAPAGASIAADLLEIEGQTRVYQRAAAANDIPFLMVDETDGVTPETGLSVTAQRSLDGGAFGSATGTVSEVGNGIYVIDASAADMTADNVFFRMSATGAADTFIHIRTKTT